MSGQKITVFLADDHQILVDGITSLVAKDPLLEVVGHCGDGLQVLPRVEALRPQVLVLDISLPGIHGLDLCRLSKAKMPEMRVMMLTMHSNRKCVSAALRNGATGYLIKEAASVEFCQAVRAVAAGEVYLGEGVPRSVLEEVNEPKHDPRKSLSDRERDILRLIADGQGNRQIAEALHVSLEVITAAQANIMQKFKLPDETALAEHAIRCNAALTV